MNLKKYYGKNVTIISDDGDIVKGFVDDYVYPEDNEDGKESIIVDAGNDEFYEFNQDSIQQITVH